MSSHSLAEAQHHLPELVERALKGEPVVITRDGAPVVELRACPAAERAFAAQTPRPVSEEGLNLLDQLRVVPTRTPTIDSVALVRQIRDEGW